MTYRIFYLFKMITVKPTQNLYIFGDLQNYDDFITVTLGLMHLPYLKGLVITGGAWTNPGTGAFALQNLCSLCKRDDVQIFIGSVKSTFDEENHTLGTFSKRISMEEMIDVDLLGGALGQLKNQNNIRYRRDFVEEITSQENVAILSIGTMTDVLKVIELPNVKVVYQQGGRIKGEEVIEKELDANRINPDASSNLFLDPIAADECLRRAGDKIYWIMSDVVPGIRTDQKSIDRLIEIRNSFKSNRNRRILDVNIRYLKSFHQRSVDLPVSDASAFLLMLFPELIGDNKQLVQTKKLRINKNVFQNVQEFGNYINVTVQYHKDVGSMIESEEFGTETKCVTGFDQELADTILWSLIDFENGIEDR